MSVAMCRACLTESLGMHFIRNTQLQGVYEKLSDTKLIVEDGRPETVCYTCYLQLQRCHDFSIMSQKADIMLTQLYRNGIKISSDAVAVLHKTLDSLGSMKPVPPEDCSTHEDIAPLNDDQPLEECQIQVDVTFKQEPDPVKVELVDIEEGCITEDIKIEVTSEDNEHEHTKNSTPCLVGASLMKPETQLKEEKLFHKCTCDTTLSKPYTCERCDKTVTLEAKFKQLNNCFKKCHNGCQLKRHMRSHAEEKPFACDQCNKTFSQSSYLRKHKKTHTKEKPYICTECNESFSLQGSLRLHIVKSHKGNKTNTQCVKIQKLSACDRCGKTFPNGYQLKRHMRSHTGEKPFACEQCDKSFSDGSNLKKHMICHTGEKSYICTECNASFALKVSLQRHMRSHTGEKPFVCDICQKSQPDASLLRRHMRIHTGEKPYICDACGKAYSDKDNFKRHMRLHTGEKPYTCKLCDYKSAHAYCLKLHLAKKHLTSHRD